MNPVNSQNISAATIKMMLTMTMKIVSLERGLLNKFTIPKITIVGEDKIIRKTNKPPDLIFSEDVVRGS